MTARFIPPDPNCGHVDEVTFTFDVDRELFMCVLCNASVGRLFPKPCSRCGRMPLVGTQHVDTICTVCQRDRRAARRRS